MKPKKEKKEISAFIEEILKELDGTDFEFIDLKIALKYKDVLWRDYNKIKVILQKSLKRIAEKVAGEMIIEERKRYKKGDFLEHRDEYNKVYNEARQDMIKKAKEMGIKIKAVKEL